MSKTLSAFAYYRNCLKKKKKNQGKLNKSNCKRDSKITACKQSYIYVKPSEKVVMPVMLSLTRFSVQIISSQILTEE